MFETMCPNVNEMSAHQKISRPIFFFQKLDDGTWFERKSFLDGYLMQELQIKCVCSDGVISDVTCLKMRARKAPDVLQIVGFEDFGRVWPTAWPRLLPRTRFEAS